MAIESIHHMPSNKSSSVTAIFSLFKEPVNLCLLHLELYIHYTILEIYQHHISTYEKQSLDLGTKTLFILVL